MFTRRKKFYKKADLEPAIAQMQINRGETKAQIPFYEKKGGIWTREAEGNRRDVKSMDLALRILRKA